jgi:hypothetical protein
MNNWSEDVNEFRYSAHLSNAALEWQARRVESRGRKQMAA